jgi:aminomethyltransferase
METPIKTIPLNDLHAALGGKMVPFAGYMMPVRYSSDIEEHLCVRQGVGVFDVSHMGEFFVEGPQALALIQKVTSNDASTLVIGQAQYSCYPNEEGGIVDDLIHVGSQCLQYRQGLGLDQFAQYHGCKSSQCL